MKFHTIRHQSISISCTTYAHAQLTHHLILQRHRPGYRSNTSTQWRILSSVPSASPFAALSNTRVLSDGQHGIAGYMVACDNVVVEVLLVHALHRPKLRMQKSWEGSNTLLLQSYGIPHERQSDR